MTIIFLFLCPAIFALFWIIRIQISLAQRRYLVDTYGIDYKKLQKMSNKKLKALKRSIHEAQEKGNAFQLEEVLRPYRP